MKVFYLIVGRKRIGGRAFAANKGPDQLVHPELSVRSGPSLSALQINWMFWNISTKGTVPDRAAPIFFVIDPDRTVLMRRMV